MPHKMNPEIKERWCNALTNGEYKQGKGTLKTSTGEEPPKFCCLGVLTDLYLKEKNLTWRHKSQSLGGVFYWELATLPEDVRDWAGIDPEVGSKVQYSESYNTLAAENDLGETFERIAQIIKENL